jgi:transcriptional regulator with XRE-family HTH domain
MNDLSQEKLAEKAEVHPTYIGKIERGEMNPSIVFLEKIARGFNITLAQLLTFPDDSKITEAKTQDIEMLIEFLADALERAKSYKKKKPPQP